MTDHVSESKHPRAFEPSVFVLNIILAVLGAIIGMQIITTLGVTPNTSLIGVLVAIALSRIPGAVFSKYRSFTDRIWFSPIFRVLRLLRLTRCYCRSVFLICSDSPT